MPSFDDKEIGRYICYILRHKPQLVGITPDKGGWIGTDELISVVAVRFNGFDMTTLEEIVANDNKQRYSFNGDKSKIRANQGHSYEVDLGLEAIKPPKVLYHGTAERFADSIKSEGIKKMTRQYVHLSADTETAHKVGIRHGKPVIFEVNAEEMYGDGCEFYLSENKVWLTDYVGTKYIKELLC